MCNADGRLITKALGAAYFINLTHSCFHRWATRPPCLHLCYVWPVLWSQVPASQDPGPHSSEDCYCDEWNCSIRYHACILRQLEGLCNACFHWIILHYKVAFPFSRWGSGGSESLTLVSQRHTAALHCCGISTLSMFDGKAGLDFITTNCCPSQRIFTVESCDEP